MTRQDYVQIADVLIKLNKNKIATIFMAAEFANELKINNPNFKQDIFMKYIKDKTNE